MTLRHGTLLYYLVQWLIIGGALFVTSLIVPGFRLRNFTSALVAALALAVANITITPLLMFLAFPINVLTLGLFTFVVNGAVLKLCAAVLKDFEVASWFSAILGAILFAVINTGFHYLVF